jgi:hypothetical protein
MFYGANKILNQFYFKYIGWMDFNAFQIQWTHNINVHLNCCKFIEASQKETKHFCVGTSDKICTALNKIIRPTYSVETKLLRQSVHILLEITIF